MSRSLVIVGVVALVAVAAIGAFVVGRETGHAATNTTTTTTSAASRPSTMTPGAPPPLPMVTDCGAAPVRKPTTLHWCQSMCSSYMTNIVWKTWGPLSATGVGTFVTKTTIARPGQTPIASSATGRGTVSCGTATPIHHPDTRALLSDPQEVTVCPTGANSARRVLVFTRATWWTDGTSPTTKSTPALVPQICG